MSDDANAKIMVVSTAGSEEEARRIAAGLLSAELAACVNISSPVSSLYRWRGEIQSDSEYMLFIKTVKRLFREVAETIGEVHSYDVPEIIALDITGGSDDYLDWVADSVAR